jgi:hypothetical protein
LTESQSAEEESRYDGSRHPEFRWFAASTSCLLGFSKVSGTLHFALVPKDKFSGPPFGGAGLFQFVFHQ